MFINSAAKIRRHYQTICYRKVIVRLNRKCYLFELFDKEWRADHGDLSSLKFMIAYMYTANMAYAHVFKTDEVYYITCPSILYYLAKYIILLGQVALISFYDLFQQYQFYPLDSRPFPAKITLAHISCGF